MVHIKHLKKGDVLVREGDSSTSMYWVQSGTLRLYKKKGNGYIELGVVHSGEIVGELSFLDNQPRSASVEALQPCDIIEIPRGKFDEFLGQQPSWMKSLLHTLVKRLRTTNNRVKELETASTVYARDDVGRTFKQHEFLSNNEVLRLCAALVLTGTRYAEKQSNDSLKVKAGWIQFFGGQIANIHVSKVTTFLELMQDAGLVKIDKQKDHVDVYILDLDRVEKFIFWLQEENSKTENKKLQISDKAMTILNAINEYGEVPDASSDAEEFTVNMQDVFTRLAEAKEVSTPFEWSSYNELVKAGISKEVRMASETEKPAVLNLENYHKLYPHLALHQKFKELNIAKREANS